jgi:hypothetical protein
MHLVILALVVVVVVVVVVVAVVRDWVGESGDAIRMGEERVNFLRHLTRNKLERDHPRIRIAWPTPILWPLWFL